jgi:inositol-phosphate transport system permease protein
VIRLKASRVLVYLIAVLLITPILMMYTMLFLGSVSNQMVGLIPKHFSLEKWEFLKTGNLNLPGSKLVTKSLFPSVYKITLNTFLLAVGVSVTEVLLASLAGYAISRYKFRGRATFLKTILVLHAFPSISLLIALYFVLRSIGMLNSILGVVLTKAALELPLGIWVMKGFYDSIPWELEMAALVDGLSRLKAWAKIILPNVKPGIAALSIFAFLSGWSEFIFILTFIYKETNWTLSMLIRAVIGDWRFVDYNLLAALSLYYMIPVLIFYIFTQKYLMRITLGGIKG